MGTDQVDPIAFLAGTWTVTRSLEDERTLLRGTFRGVARFYPDGPDSLVLDERGRLDWPTWTGESSRAYRYRRDGPFRTTVLFPDGREFHPLELSPHGYDVEHRCGEDRYLGHFVLLDADGLAVSWRVSGPNKALLLAGEYRRS